MIAKTMTPSPSQQLKNPPRRGVGGGKTIAAPPFFALAVDRFFFSDLGRRDWQVVFCGVDRLELGAVGFQNPKCSPSFYFNEGSASGP